MKNKMLTALAILATLLALPCDPAQVTLTWTPTPNAAGYKVYLGPAVLTYTNAVDAGNTNLLTLTGLTTNVPYHFTLVSYYSNRLESDFSPELIYTLSTPSTSSTPSTLLLTTFLEGASGSPLGPWSAITQWQALIPATNAAKFYRPRLTITSTN